MNRYDEFRETVLDCSDSFIRSSILQAAFQLNVFETLGGGSKSPATLAQEIHADPRALGLFLNALVSMNFIRKDGNSYYLTEVGKSVF